MNLTDSTLSTWASCGYDPGEALKSSGDLKGLENLLADEHAPRAGLLLFRDDAELQRGQAEWNENFTGCPWIDCATMRPGALTESLLRLLSPPDFTNPFGVPNAMAASYAESTWTEPESPEEFSASAFFADEASCRLSNAGFPASRQMARGREPFVNKAMTWLRLANLLIAGGLPVPSFIFSGYGAGNAETRREILRLLRLYIAHRPRHAVFLALTPQETLLLPEEDLEQLRLRIRIA